MIKRKIVLLLATGFGLGLAPVASGTFGTLLGVGIVVAMSGLPGIAWHIALSVAFVLVAIPICGMAEGIFKKKDDGRIVADEYLTFPICVIGLPWVDNLWLLVVAFLTHRILDIIKPRPAMQIQDIGGGTGIVLDDVVSSLYALLLNHAVWIVYQYFCCQ
ncbi:MAG: phosphatidylglycerophosphatase A [Kiritimatiellae bacterium]|nr:phosphatidylglycerophosphatase A [Kiritimatiellia bacterium]